MKFTPTQIEGVVIIDIEPRTDDRGFFARSFCAREFAAQGLHTTYLQANMSYNHHQGTLRGMHWQAAPHAEVKVVRCTRGAIYDVAVDVRPDSPSFRQWVGVELTADNARSLYIPEGCAHGYLTLTQGAEIHYLVSAFYAPEHERGARWNDPAFGITWPETADRIISPRDEAHPEFVWAK